MKNHSTDMTKGNIPKLIINFALPLLAGNLFQQLYNTVDTIIVGNFVSGQALGAIGSTTMIINTMIGFFTGLSTGGTIVIGQFFGARQEEQVRKSSATLISGTVILGIAFTFLGIILTPKLLYAVSTPDEVFHDAKTYLIFYFSGVIFLMLYNMASGILRAVGDSRRPFYFLIISSLTNVALDFFFVLICKMGIAGVALATVISQGISAVLVVIVLLKTKECYGISLKSLHIDFEILKRILKFGIPGAFQLSITFLSNTFVQKYINFFGYECIAGWTAFNKVDSFCLLPMQSVSLSVTTFVSQNYGANQIERAKKGVLVSTVLIMTISALVMIPMLIFSHELVCIFNRNEKIIYYAEYFLKVSAFFYVIRCLNQIYAGALRGFGNATVPMCVLLGSFVVFRQTYLFTATKLTDSFFPIALAYPIGWGVCSAAMVISYIVFMKRNKKSFKI